MKRKSQYGAVSLFIVMFAALLMTIVTISFVSLMVSTQKQSTSSDLSQSALDSAQAGVEDAKRALLQYQTCVNTGGDCSTLLQNFNDGTCTDAVKSVLTSGGVVSPSWSTTGVAIQQGTGTNDSKYQQSYTCVKVSLNSPNYKAALTADESVLIPLRGVGTVKTVKIQWYQQSDLQAVNKAEVSLTSPSSLSPLVTQGNGVGQWNANTPSLIRSQLMQIGGNGFKLTDFDNTAAVGQSDANTLFLYPVGKTGGKSVPATNTIPFSNDVRQAPTGTPAQVTCYGDLASGGDAGYACSAEVTLPEAIGGGDTLSFLRLTSLYNPTHYSVTLLGDDGNVVDFNAVQPTIDSTGKANDLFRRVASRVTLGSSDFPYPDATIELTGSLCKNFVVTDKTADYSSTCKP